MGLNVCHTTKLSKTDIVNNLKLFNLLGLGLYYKKYFTVSVDLKLEDCILLIQSCISVLDDEKKKEIWKILTCISKLTYL
jgi:hypothetical protein